ncbi:homoserine dehydrogenase, partial [Isoptericola sp. NPDC060257]
MTGAVPAARPRQAADPTPTVLRVALLGCGVVGSQVAQTLVQHADDLAARAGARLELVGIAVRDASRPRDGVGTVVPADLLTEDADALVDRADLVIELMGGIEPARGLIHRAIAGGASVVTANKALLAAHGPELFEAADAAGVDLSFEAAVAGAIPIVRPVRESLAGDQVRRVLGIVNGTTNYVLDQMTTHGLDLEEALKEAQTLGYAEA